MIISDQIDQLPYFSCPRHNHAEQLSLVCLQETCTRNMLICPLCQLQVHQHHNTTPLKMFLQRHLQEYDHKNDQLMLEKLGQLQEVQANAKVLLSRAKETFLYSLYKLQAKIAEYFTVLADKLLEGNRYKKKADVRRLLLKFIERGELGSYNQVLRAVKANSDHSNKSLHQYYLVSTNSKFTSLQLQLANIASEKKFTEMSRLFAVVKDPTVKPDYSWGQFKGSKILIQGPVATQSLNCSSGERFALMDCGQPYFCDISTAVRIRKVKGWIGVGICLKNLIVKAGYKFNYTMPYHGSYLISSNGYSWSHSNPEWNSVSKSFTFSEGDIIKIDYSLARREVVFRNVKKDVSFKLEAIDAPPFDRYVPCVNLCNPGDQVEILNNIE